MRRLSAATLDGLPADVARPGFDRAMIKTGVVHLGIGAFHRAHQAVVFDDLIQAGDPRWGVLGASLRSPSVARQLNPQDGLYSLAVRDGGDEQRRIIGAVKGVRVGPDDPAALVQAMADPEVNIVTLTVTEKGYPPDAAGGALAEPDPDLAADLAGLARPRTAPGFIVAALAERRARGLVPFTAISCDNLPSNGRRLSAVVTALARWHDPGLADWIERHGRFPETMVDRIVPATTAQDLETTAARLGVRDEAMVKTEPFTQWVIEDSFAGPRPDFASVGVQITDRVAPWEEAKLRLLNGAHSAIAYLGGLARTEFVHQFVAMPEGARLVNRLWDEAETTLDPPAGLDLAAYRCALMARFANSALNHQTRQIAIDGSQKLPQRLLAPISIRLARGQPIATLALAVAAWMRWQEGRDDQGRAFTVNDPLAGETARRLTGLRSPADKVRALAGIDAIFPTALASDSRFIAAVTEQFAALAERGASAILTQGW